MPDRPTPHLTYSHRTLLSPRIRSSRRDAGASSHWIDNAHDDYILSLAYSDELQQIATSSADQGAKLWDLTADTEPSESLEGYSVPEGRKGKRCCGVLLGHTADVSHIKWNPVHSLWVTGSEDYSVRFWTADGVESSKWLPGDAITALAVDQKQARHACNAVWRV